MTADVEHLNADGTRICSMADALGLVGDRWSLHVIREVGMGVRRFEGIQRRTGAPREMLTSRLRKLESVGVIARSPYSERPPRFEYTLTTSGEELLPVLAALYAWGERHASPGPAKNCSVESRSSNQPVDNKPGHVRGPGRPASL